MCRAPCPPPGSPSFGRERPDRAVAVASLARRPLRLFPLRPPPCLLSLLPLHIFWLVQVPTQFPCGGRVCRDRLRRMSLPPRLLIGLPPAVFLSAAFFLFHGTLHARGGE